MDCSTFLSRETEGTAVIPLQCRNILEATEALPIIGDGDTGFGNALSVKRTVRGFARAGFAGILIEDQVSCRIGAHFVSSHRHQMVSSQIIRGT